MTRVFADTSFYIALLSPGDRWHRSAMQISRMAYHVVTTEYVLLELGNYLAGISRQGFVRLLETLQRDTRTIIVPCSSLLFEQGTQLYAQRQDKTWSLTDCISFLVMKEQGAEAALTCDHHFVQAGFKRLLESG